jgi:hypothetical protein
MRITFLYFTNYYVSLQELIPPKLISVNFIFLLKPVNRDAHQGDFDCGLFLPKLSESGARKT